MMEKRYSDTTLGIVKAVIEAAEDGVFLTDKKGNFIMANKAFERITGINREELVGQHTELMIEKGWVSTAVNLDVIKDFKSRTKYITYPSGKQVLVSAGMIFRENGKPAGCISIMRDLTELNDLKDKLTKSQITIAQFQETIDHLKEQLDHSKHAMVAQSTDFRHVLTLAKRIARSDATVLITGESGVGKDVLAQFIHKHSRRDNTGSLVKVDCAALPATLLESELFGYEKGAFTDARTNGKHGMLEIANGGTLFLDEIGEFPLELQSKLLNVLQDREIKKVGGTTPLPIDVRIVAATNMNLEQMVKEKKFREDLYYRLNVVPVYISPLRKRRQDILPLIDHFLKIFNQKYEANKGLATDVLNSFMQYDWPGNVREIRNTIERLVVTSTNDIITFRDLPDDIRNLDAITASVESNAPHPPERTGPLKRSIEEFEKTLIQRSLERHGNLVDAARDLHIDISTLTRKNKKYGLTGYTRT